MRRIALIAPVLMAACASAPRPMPQRPPAVVSTVDTPVDLAGPLTLDRAISLAIERHPLRPAPGGGPVEAREQRAHEREVRYAVSIAYGEYVRASLVRAAQERSVRLAETIAQSIRSRATPTPLDTERLPIEIARVRMAEAHSAWSLDRARTSLNGLLARPADAPIGAPSDDSPRTIAMPLDDLVQRALRNHAPDPNDHEAATLVRGTLDDLVDQLQQLAREWDVLRNDAIAHADTLRARLESAARANGADFDALWAAEQMVTDVEVSRAQLVSDLIGAAAELQRAVGEPLEITALPPAPAPTVVAAMEPASPAPAVASAAPASSAPPSPAPSAARGRHPGHNTR